MNPNARQHAHKQKDDAHRDPLTGAPGAHPLGAGVGAAGGGTSGAAVGSSVVGPLSGGLAGKAVAEMLDPAFEDAYWRTHFSDRTYVASNVPYILYQSAYRTGYEGRSKHPGKTFEEVEPILRRDYEAARGDSALGWEKARSAARDAWDRGEPARGVITTGRKT